MSGFYHDGLIFGVEAWKFAAAVALLAMGLFLIQCGARVCWTRFFRRKGGQPQPPVIRW